MGAFQKSFSWFLGREIYGVHAFSKIHLWTHSIYPLSQHRIEHTAMPWYSTSWI
jgi:hypothetical protein